MTQEQAVQQQEKVIIKLTPRIAKRVPKEVRAELVKQYRKLFTGFSLAKWTKNNSWGRAWQNGINLNGAMIMIAKKQLTPNNQAVKYMENVHTAYKKHWSKMSMTHSERDTKPKLSDKVLKKMHTHAMRMINDATNVIMDILRRYNERLNEMIIEQVAERQQGATNQPAQKMSQPQNRTPVAQPAPTAPEMTQPAVAAEQANTKPVTPQQNALQQVQPQPAVAQMAAEKAVAKPAVKMPAVAKPAVEIPAIAKPVVAKPAVEMPAVAAKPAVAKPAVAKPAVEMPAVARPAVAKSVAEKRPYTAPQISVNQVKAHTRSAMQMPKEKKTYVAPTLTERKSAFECAKNNVAIKESAERAVKQMQIRRQINIFTITQSQYRSAA